MQWKEFFFILYFSDSNDFNFNNISFSDAFVGTINVNDLSHCKVIATLIVQTNKAAIT